MRALGSQPTRANSEGYDEFGVDALLIKMGEMRKSPLVQCLTQLPQDTIKDVRNHLFTEMVLVCKLRCKAQAQAEERKVGTPYRAEDVYGMMAYVMLKKESRPKGPLSQFSSNKGVEQGQSPKDKG